MTYTAITGHRDMECVPRGTRRTSPTRKRQENICKILTV